MSFMRGIDNGREFTVCGRIPGFSEGLLVGVFFSELPLLISLLQGSLQLNLPIFFILSNTPQLATWNKLPVKKSSKNNENWKVHRRYHRLWPNVMVCAPDVLAAIETSAEVKDTIKFTQNGVVTEQLFAIAKDDLGERHYYRCVASWR